MLKLRLITGLILFVVALVCIFLLPPALFQLVISIALLWAAWEWTALVPIKHIALRILYLVVIALFTILTFPLSPFILAAMSIVWLWAFAAVISYSCNGKSLGFATPAVKYIFGVLAFAAACDAILLIRALDYQTHTPWLLLALMVICGTDVGAYFIGRFYGRKLLAPKVSPKKTWAGLWGGLVFSLALSLIFTSILLYRHAIALPFFCRVNIAALITIGFAVMGDLVESMVKRQVNIKDSGTLLPGHGGMLDRLDSIIAATPIFLLLGFVNLH